MIAVELVRAEIERRIALCEAVSPADTASWVGDWQPLPDDSLPCEAFIAAHSPSFILGVYRQHLDVLERHTETDIWRCTRCYGSFEWPCVEVESVLALYRDVQEGAENE